MYSRRYGSYPGTAFEEVIEAKRRGTWTINALSAQHASGSKRTKLLINRLQARMNIAAIPATVRNQRTLMDFRSAFAALTAPEKSEALQCVLKSVTVHPQKLDLEIFELQEFLPGSQNRKEWLPGLDSNWQPFG